jgi:hypothetical protein
LAVRLKLRISREGKSVEVIALLNSGYEADTPQLMIPVWLAKELKLWPPPPESLERVFDTAGGPLRVWVVRRAAKVKVVASGAESKEVLVDLVISQLADEPLISDLLAGELEIAVEDFARGLWRFRWEPKDSLRPSEKPSA